MVWKISKEHTHKSQSKIAVILCKNWMTVEIFELDKTLSNMRNLNRRLALVML